MPSVFASGSIFTKRGLASLASRIAPLTLALVFPITFFITSCSIGQGATASANGVAAPTGVAGAALTLSPSSTTVVSGGTQQFTAKVSDTSNPAVKWSTSAGTISSSGLFTAPSVTTSQTVIVKTTTVADPREEATAQVTLIPPIARAAVTLSPSSATVVSGGTQQFTAMVSETSNTAVKWSASAGTISSSGLFTAPSVTTSQTVIVKTTSVADASAQATAEVTVVPTTARVAVTLSPSSTTVVSGSTEQFTARVSEASNTAVEWSASAGTISRSGLFTAPTVTSSQTVIVKTTTVADARAEATAEVTVVPLSIGPTPIAPPPTGADNRYCSSGDQPSFGSTDGPANLPQRCINTALSNTPSPGKQTLVAAGGDLNSALNNASCGDVILVQAGKTFAGPITLPAKSCDSEHWITLRTSAPDSSLPAEGMRLTPCYAGISSLPARPAYPCPSPSNVLAKIQIETGAGAITVASGANYYRMIGLEVTRQAGTGVAYGLVTMTGADHLIFDRVWIHGTALDETVRGIFLGDSTNVAIIDSYLNDFHCAAKGDCTDAQTINGGNSLLPTGPYKIVDNFLEAAAENILLGGGPGSTVPADIEIRRNHIFKPTTWMPGAPNFIGKSFIVKNLFEIKNAERLLLEGNVMENSWGGFSQVGWGIVLTPRGTWAADRDITIRYNTISHVGAGFQIAAADEILSNGARVDSLASERFSIHDVTVDDMSASAYNGAGIGFQISSSFAENPPLNNLTINHVTMLNDPKKTLLVIGSNLHNPLRPSNIVFTNNIAVAGEYSVWSTGVPLTACAKSSQPSTTFNQCWSSYTITSNAIIAYPPSQGPWPTGNVFPATTAAVGFTNLNEGNFGLLPSSPYRDLGIPDRTELGADITTLNAEIDGVQ
jgi:hypothetical protein